MRPLKICLRKWFYIFLSCLFWLPYVAHASEADPDLIGTTWSQPGRVGYFTIGNPISGDDGTNSFTMAKNTCVFSKGGRIDASGCRFVVGSGVGYGGLLDCPNAKKGLTIEDCRKPPLYVKFPDSSWRTFAIKKGHLVVTTDGGTQLEFVPRMGGSTRVKRN